MKVVFVHYKSLSHKLASKITELVSAFPQLCLPMQKRHTRGPIN